MALRWHSGSEGDGPKKVVGLVKGMRRFPASQGNEANGIYELGSVDISNFQPVTPGEAEPAPVQTGESSGLQIALLARIRLRSTAVDSRLHGNDANVHTT